MDPSVDSDYGLLDDHAILVKDGRIDWIGPSSDAPQQSVGVNRLDAQGALLTPGLIDSHTHLVYGGERANEFEARLNGASYAEIARAGGGILSTVRATRASSEAQLFDAALPRLEALCREGVTTVEIKSGYGLNLDDELKMLRVARQLQQALPVRVRTSLLAAHALPPEYQHNADGYIALICEQIIPQVAEQQLAQAVDVFCESIGFSVAQCERVFACARQHGLGIKAHTEQLSQLGGTRLAASYNAWSVDHIEYLNDADISALRDCDTVACLLPGAFYFLNETRKPPVAKLRDAGIPLALASDLNPGSSPLASLRLMMNMGCVLFGLTPAEALAGVTLNGARALGMGDQLGMLRVGQRADLLLWDLDHPAQLAYEFGPTRLTQRVVDGRIYHPQTLQPLSAQQEVGHG